MPCYAAFLRGINVGRRTIKMDRLRHVLVAAGFDSVRTVLASGNVVFEVRSGTPAAARAKLQAAIKAAFGFEVRVIVRSAKEIRALVEQGPFRRVKVTPKTRLYVTFLSKPSKSKLKLPYKALGGDYQILEVTRGHVTSVLTLTPESGTTRAMDVLGQEFGAEITTRNWNTITKLAKELGQEGSCL